MMAPMACSRTPKCTLRAPQLPAPTSPPFLTTTFVEPARSADPPISSGSFAARAFSNFPDAARVACASLGVNSVRPSSQPPGRRRPAGGEWGARDHERRPVAGAARRGERGVERAEIVAVRHALHVPAVALEPCGRIVREREVGLAVDGDAIVVVHPDQTAQLQ